MNVYEGFKDILKIQKFRRFVGYSVFYCFTAVLSYAYTNNTTRAGYSRADQYYAAYPAGTELLGDSDKLYKAALGNCFEAEEWGSIEFCIMSKHFERQGKAPYAYHAVTLSHDECAVIGGEDDSRVPCSIIDHVETTMVDCYNRNNIWHTFSPLDN